MNHYHMAGNTITFKLNQIFKINYIQNVAGSEGRYGQKCENKEW